MKLYELDIQEDGKVKVQTELTPQDMKILLSFGMVSMLNQGLMVASLAHHFPPGDLPDDDEEENPYEDLTTRKDLN